MLAELERTLALLAFEDPANCPFGDLLNSSHRQKVGGGAQRVCSATTAKGIGGKCCLFASLRCVKTMRIVL